MFYSHRWQIIIIYPVEPPDIDKAGHRDEIAVAPLLDWREERWEWRVLRLTWDLIGWILAGSCSPTLPSVVWAVQTQYHTISLYRRWVLCTVANLLREIQLVYIFWSIALLLTASLLPISQLLKLRSSVSGLAGLGRALVSSPDKDLSIWPNKYKV